MSATGRRWSETAQVRHPRLLRACRLVFAAGVSVWFGWWVVRCIASGQATERWAVVGGLAAGCALSGVLVVACSERVSRRAGRWLYWGCAAVVSLLTVTLLSGGLAARGFAGTVLLCQVVVVGLAWLTGHPQALADGFTHRFAPNTRADYLAQRDRINRSQQITGLPPLITSFQLSRADQLELMALADQLRRARRRFRPGPTVRGRLLFVGDDAPGQAQLEAAIAYRSRSPLLRMNWVDWDPEGDWTNAFDEAFSMARKRRDGVIVINGGTRFSDDEAARLAAAMDAIDWPLIMIFAAEERHDLERAITARLNCTIRLQTPSATPVPARDHPGSH